MMLSPNLSQAHTCFLLLPLLAQGLLRVTWMCFPEQGWAVTVADLQGQPETALLWSPLPACAGSGWGCRRIDREAKRLLWEVAKYTAPWLSLSHQGRDELGGVGFSCQYSGISGYEQRQLALWTGNQPRGCCLICIMIYMVGSQTLMGRHFSERFRQTHALCISMQVKSSLEWWPDFWLFPNLCISTSGASC